MGSYRMLDGVVVKTIIKEHNLLLVLPGALNFLLHPEAADHYFIKESNAQITCIENENKNRVQLNLFLGTDVQIGKFVDNNEVIQPAPPLAILV